MIIYQMTNNINNKIYVGSTTRKFKVRFGEHVGKLNSNKHNNSHLQSSWNRYGEESFKFEILVELGTSELVLRLIEKMYIYNLNPEYNIDEDPTINPMYGRNHTKETKRKIGETRKLLKIPSPMKGKVLTDEHKRKLSEVRKGKYVGENHPRWGKYHTEESKRKISEVQLGRKQPQYAIDNMIKTRLRNKTFVGEKNPNSKLTEAEVLDIRRLYKTGNYTYKQLAIVFNVSIMTISNIINYKVWGHV